jgi:hypothetical protein
MRKLTILAALVAASLCPMVPAAAQAGGPIIHDAAKGAALGCLFGGCRPKNVGRGAAAGVVGFPLLREVLGPHPVWGGHAPSYGGPCAQYPADTVQRDRCEEGAARARQRDFEESVRRAEQDGYCAVRPQDCGGHVRGYARAHYVRPGWGYAHSARRGW